MFCHFCGKNFDATEGFDDLSRSGHHLVRCEKCAYSNMEDEYDWRREIARRGRQSSNTQTRSHSSFKRS